MKAGGRLALSLFALAGCASVPGLVGQLEGGTVVQRRNAARGLCLMGERASEAGPALVRALGDEDAEVRRHSAAALSLVGTHSAEVVAALQSAMADEVAGVRAMATQSLGLVLFHARMAHLEGTRADEDFFKPALGDAARGPVEALVKALSDDSAWVRRAALRSLAFLGPDARAAVPAIVELARSSASTYTRLIAVEALAMQGPDASQSVAALRDLAQGDPSADVKKYASEMVASLSGAAEGRR